MMRAPHRGMVVPLLLLAVGSPAAIRMNPVAASGAGAEPPCEERETGLSRGSEQDQERAVARLLEAAACYGRAHNSARQARMLATAAVLETGLGRGESALDHGRTALALLADRPDSPAHAVVLTAVGQAEQYLGRTDSALARYRAALPVAHRGRLRPLEGILLNNLGTAFHQLGWIDSATVYLDQALALERGEQDKFGEAVTLNNLGRVNQTLARPDSALALLHVALALRRQVGDRAGEGATLNNIAYSFDLLGRPDSSLTYLRRSLATSLAAGQRSFAALTLINMGRVQSESGRLDSALLAVRQGLAIKREVGDLTGQSWGLDDLGQVQLALGQSDSAVANYRAALALLHRTGDGARAGQTLFHLASAFHRRKVGRDLRVATSYYDSASALRGETSRRSGGDADRLSFAEQDVGLYEEWALAWLARGDEVGAPASAWAALAAAEKGRARALLDLMRGAAAREPELPAGRDLASEGRGWGTTIERSGAAAALVYLVTRDTLVLWVVRPPGEVSVLRVPVSRDTLAARVRDARAALAPDDRCERAPTPSAAAGRDAVRALSELLLPPAARALLPPAGELLVLPHGPLNLVPFAALPLGASDDALGLRYALRYAPSLSTLREADALPGLDTGVARVAALRRALVVGNPRMPKVRFCDVEFTPSPLPGAERSSRDVAAQLGAEVLIGGDATERAVRSRIAQAPVVHLETHGFAYETDALARASFVALAPGPEAKPAPADDGLLTVGEVLDQLPTLSADLIVLSACQTGLGNLKEAEGTVGLQRAFLAKHARSVLVSLWNVPDEATALLMESFYRQWLAEPQAGKAEALRRAQAQVRRHREFAEPRYWAAFQLAGAR
ncbi:MAG TPA: CHAT domain-containing tetratricopeptide repeat protein [Gemmatimonadales bacterium]|nr:CHAT domain-containing tetratricopeptide repeat protein [Gemmatimonadales bacterium]